MTTLGYLRQLQPKLCLSIASGHALRSLHEGSQLGSIRVFLRLDGLASYTARHVHKGVPVVSLDGSCYSNKAGLPVISLIARKVQGLLRWSSRVLVTDSATLMRSWWTGSQCDRLSGCWSVFIREEEVW